LPDGSSKTRLPEETSAHQFLAAPTVPGDLPPEAPIDMPIQSFRHAPRPGRRVVTTPDDAVERRILVVVATLALGMFAATEMMRPLAGLSLPRLLDAGLFMLVLSLFCWIALGFVNATIGFCVLLGERGRAQPSGRAAPIARRRTAVLVPIYHEDMGPIAGRVARMSAMLVEAGVGRQFDIFLLSDSGPAAANAEQAAFRALKAQCALPVYYRRRPKNVARKPGNIADWVRRFGGAYDHMIVLDADSLMTGEVMARLASVMDRSPGVALIQTVPSVVGGRTIFARWQQFAAAAYGPISTAGLIWWSGAEATFWGHNAIIRVKAFAESCGLPELSGPEPMGGHIMSHDMVEAALLRRRGWAVHMVSIEGSHEEFPPTLSDHAVRDRRWCQGNLQHLRLLASGGFHWVNRLQLLMGASAYLTSPLWLMLALISLLQGVGLVASASFAPSVWPLLLTMSLLFGPKLLALCWIMIDRAQRDALGGTRKVLRSMAIEIPLAMVVAPVTMISQTMAVFDIARGRPSGWRPQRRESDGIPLRQALTDYRYHVGAGLIALAMIVASNDTRPWLLPVILSLLLAPVTASLTARSDWGDRLARRGIFAVDKDVSGASPSNDLADLGALHATAMPGVDRPALSSRSATR
jgi:membrane glycosyltransferase